jgi:hypothetical protein
LLDDIFDAMRVALQIVLEIIFLRSVESRGQHSDRRAQLMRGVGGEAALARGSGAPRSATFGVAMKF